jgi:hypothetical protein
MQIEGAGGFSILKNSNQTNSKGNKTWWNYSQHPNDRSVSKMKAKNVKL